MVRQPTTAATYGHTVSMGTYKRKREVPSEAQRRFVERYRPYAMYHAPAFKRPRLAYQPGPANRRSGYDRVNVGSYRRSRLGELKNFDHNVVMNAGPGGGNTAIEDTINDIAQGTAFNERVGRRVLVKSIQIKGSVGADAIPADASIPIRWGLYLDRQTNGAAATFPDIFTVTGGVEYGAMRNLDNSSRFHIICEKQLTVGGGYATADRQDYRPVSVYFNVNHLLDFDGVTGGITELSTNNFGMYLIQAASVGSVTPTTNVRFRCTARLRYQD